MGELLVIQVCFFFKQKTAYEMRISDWSSDVCSSDLGEMQAGEGAAELAALPRRRAAGPDALEEGHDRRGLPRSEERRVGKECVSTCKSRWSQNHLKKTTHTERDTRPVNTNQTASTCESASTQNHAYK